MALHIHMHPQCTFALCQLLCFFSLHMHTHTQLALPPDTLSICAGPDAVFAISRWELEQMKMIIIIIIIL